MSSEKLTDGPWELIEIRGYTDDNGTYYDVFTGWDIEGPPPGYNAQFLNTADARAVKATPKTIKALVKIEALSGRAVGPHELGQIHQTAVDALAKARGETEERDGG